jgi:hypothetical protein
VVVKQSKDLNLKEYFNAKKRKPPIKAVSQESKSDKYERVRKAPLQI